MKIEHLAIWVRDLTLMRSFYEKYFGCVSGEPYHNAKKNFRSYFLRFGDGARLELMHQPTVVESKSTYPAQVFGIAHFAISVGSREKVDDMVARFRAEGVSLVGEPRWTGDGYYEAVILDPEGNVVEITV